MSVGFYTTDFPVDSGRVDVSLLARINGQSDVNKISQKIGKSRLIFTKRIFTKAPGTLIIRGIFHNFLDNYYRMGLI